MIKTQIGCIMNLPMWVNFLSRKQIMFFPGVLFIILLSTIYYFYHLILQSLWETCIFQMELEIITSCTNNVSTNDGSEWCRNVYYLSINKLIILLCSNYCAWLSLPVYFSLFIIIIYYLLFIIIYYYLLLLFLSPALKGKFLFNYLIFITKFTWL